MSVMPDRKIFGSQPGEPTTSYVSVPLSTTAPSVDYPPPTSAPLWPGQQTDPGSAPARTPAQTTKMVDQLTAKAERVPWIKALRIAAVVVAVFSILGGVVAYGHVKWITAQFSYMGAFYQSGGIPNTALALSVMLTIWVLGPSLSIGMIVFANMAEQVAGAKSLLESRTQPEAPQSQPSQLQPPQPQP